MVWWMVFSGVCFFGGFYVGMVMMALMSADKRADESMDTSTSRETEG